MEKKRILWLDVLKAIAFYFVILGHMSVTTAVKSWIYSFHMPLFFLVSGFTLNIEKTFASSFKDHFLKLVKRTLIPYFWIEFICLCFSYLTTVVIKGKSLGLTNNILGIFVGNGLILPNPSRPMYFALVLFMAQLLMWFVVKISKKNYSVMAVIVSVLTLFSIFTQGERMVWRLNVVPAAMFLIFVGRLLADLYNRNSEKLFKMSVSKYIALCAALFALGFLVYKFNGRPSMAGNKYGKEFICFVISAVLTSSGLALITMRLPESELLTFVGQNTFFYMGFHKPLILLYEALFPSMKKEQFFVYAVSFAIFIMLIPAAKFAVRFAPFVAAKPLRKADALTTVGAYLSIFAAFIVPYKYAFVRLFSGFFVSVTARNILMFASFAVLCVAALYIAERFFPFVFIKEK